MADCRPPNEFSESDFKESLSYVTIPPRVLFCCSGGAFARDSTVEELVAPRARLRVCFNRVLARQRKTLKTSECF
jgi:hypothetical protein